jgi:hypothetical protein
LFACSPSRGELEPESFGPIAQKLKGCKTLRGRARTRMFLELVENCKDVNPQEGVIA